MTARLICVAQEKGGAGKSLCSMLLAAALGERGYRTLVVDCDAQGTATAWSREAPNDMPFPATVISLAGYAAKVHREILKHLSNYDFIVIDCPPSIENPATHSALLISDLAIIPIPTSPADILATTGMVRLLERTKTNNKDLIAVILPNRLARTKLSNTVLKELENFGIPVMASRLTNRIAYQEAVIAGLSVSALGRHAKVAADEISALTDEVLNLLGELK